MTIETKYNINELVRYKENNENILTGITKEGRITTVGTFYDGKDTYITYTVVNPKNPLDSVIVFEQQIIERI